MATGRIGVTPTLGVRWSLAPIGGTTALSGLDDNSVSLVYSVGYEQVYRNGVLLSRGNDYTATDGTTVTLIDATITGDIIEVFAQQLVPLADAISKGQFTAKGTLLSATAASTPGVLGVGADGTVLTAASGEATGLEWATPAAPTFVGVRLEKSGNQSIADGTFTDVTWDTEKFDTDAFHDPSSNTDRITIPAGKAGYYFISAGTRFEDNVNNDTRTALRIMKNGTSVGISYLQNVGNTNGFPTNMYSLLINLAVSDYIECNVYQNSGGAKNLNGNSESTGISYFQAVYLGA